MHNNVLNKCTNDKYSFYLQVCDKLFESYRGAYDEIIKQMQEASNEKTWDCSSNNIFGLGTLFIARLKRVKDFSLFYIY